MALMEAIMSSLLHRINKTSYRKLFGWWKLEEFAKRYGIRVSASSANKDDHFDTMAILSIDDQETAELFSEGTPDDDSLLA
jgi:hypothetical protein